jgi:hypothetical protein
MHQTYRIPLALCFVLLVAAAACRGDRRNDNTVGTAGNTAVRVTDVTLGRAIGGDKSVTDKTDTFRPNDTIYAAVATDGTAPSATIRARWTFEDGQVIDESTKTIAATNRETTEFHIAKPDGWPEGKYKLEVSVNDQRAETKDFEVRR